MSLRSKTKTGLRIGLLAVAWTVANVAWFTGMAALWLEDGS